MLQLIYKITYLITLFGAVAIGVFVLSRGWNKRFNLVWVLLQLSVVIWSLGRYMMLLSEDASSALFWCRISNLGSFFVYPFFLHTVLLLLNRRSRLVPLFYGAACLLASSTASTCCFIPSSW
jgi:hypothetical protein